MRGTLRQREELQGCAFCLEPCCLGSGLGPTKKARRAGSHDGITWCERCFASMHSACWDRYRGERTNAGIKDAAVQSMSREELQQAMTSWFPCPTCRSTGKMAVWPKPRKKSLRQQIKDLEQSIREDAAFLRETESMFARVGYEEQRQLLIGVRRSSMESLARQRTELLTLRGRLAALLAAKPAQVSRALHVVHSPA
ncbi:hypothetical protein AB1Y20_022289 [Prymnesium parvum]|uniref:Uncharacterized protein n=1 Tax=Prymnesium parvum TaxID=97485 RepID=A0AB34JII2_PRYPA|mmetsp:Transcript_16210/g.24434  ORF Transcript_16210/g.24434 Transcript_16210/m.24434 type:complete len:197 (+) Transcript_16210:3-593(+)